MTRNNFFLSSLFFIYGLSIPILSNLSMIISIILVLMTSRKPCFTILSLLVICAYLIFIILHIGLYYLYDKSDLISSINQIVILAYPCIVFLAEGEAYDDTYQVGYSVQHFGIVFDNKFRFLFFCASGFFSFALVSTAYTYLNPSLIDIAGRLVVNPWNSALINAPALGLYLYPLLMIASYLINSSETISIKHTSIYILFLIVSVFVMAILQNRSSFIVLALCLVSNFILSKNRSFLMFSFLLIGILLIPYLIKLDFFEYILDRFQGDGLESLRYGLWEEGFDLAIKNPFGGFYESSTGFFAFHNIFLDVAKASGVIPTLVLICVIIVSILFGCLNSIRKLVLSILLILCVSFEPVYEASVWVFSFTIGLFIYILLNRSDHDFSV